MSKAVIQKNIVFTLEDVKYEIKFPNVGQYMDIENMRIGLTNGAYTDLIRTGLKSAHFQVDLVDAISILYVLVPQLRTDLSVTNYNELDAFTAKKIVNAYKRDIKPWYDTLMEELLKDDDDIPEPIKPKKEAETDIEGESGKHIDLN